MAILGRGGCGTVVWGGTVWLCWYAVIGRGMLGSGTGWPRCFSNWARLGSSEEVCLGRFCGFCVRGVFGGWKLGQQGILSSDTKFDVY